MLSSKIPQVKVGDVIRSLDFPGDETCYMIGQVFEINSGFGIRCKTFARIFQSKAIGFPPTFSTPEIGDHFLDNSHPGRITVL